MPVSWIIFERKSETAFGVRRDRDIESASVVLFHPFAQR
jgi:hypothetical protein